MLTTSGVDGVYPIGLPVAHIDQVERRVDSAFARIHAQPLALTDGTRAVLVIKPGASAAPPPPEATGKSSAKNSPKKGVRK